MGGRVRDKIKVYQWVGGDRPNDVGIQAKAAQDDGFKAIKMNATDECQYIDTFGKVERVLERVAAIREACGSDFGIGIDFHGRVHKPMAKVRELDVIMGPFFLQYAEYLTMFILHLSNLSSD
jgi:galactonate dehydratase